MLFFGNTGEVIRTEELNEKQAAYAKQEEYEED
jgi:hypothetical protein